MAAQKTRGRLWVTFHPVTTGFALGLNYKLSRQKKVVLEGDEETTINHIHATGRKRRGG